MKFLVPFSLVALVLANNTPLNFLIIEDVDGKHLAHEFVGLNDNELFAGLIPAKFDTKTNLMKHEERFVSIENGKLVLSPVFNHALRMNEDGYFTYNNDPVFEICEDDLIRYDSECSGRRKVKISRFD